MEQGSPNLPAVGRIHAALSKPLQQRCIEVEAIIEQSLLKDVVTFLPALLESIFSFNNQPGWCLGNCRSQHVEYKMLRNLLAPNGPLLRAVYRIWSDSSVKFEFPLACLNFETRAFIEESGLLTGFYSDKLQMSPSGQPTGSLHLNAFEFYFFHFAYFLIGTGSAKAFNWVNPQDALYPSLVEDYLLYFLPPQSGSVPPSLAGVGPGGSAAAHRVHSSYLHTPPSYIRLSHSPGSPTLLSLPMMMRGPRSSPPHSFISDVVESEATPAHTIIQILVELWLSPSSVNWVRTLGPNTSPGTAAKQMDSYLPSVDQMRIVRLLIKHLHYFTNSASPVSHYSPSHGLHSQAHWEEFKRNSVSHYARKKVYCFLRHCFERWPLDSSFRIVLETWLTYIQPWRYTDITITSNPDVPRGVVGKEPHEERGVESRWQVFVTDNLLFYTVVLRRMVERSLRMDLSTGRNTFMVYRVSKVLCVPNLENMLRYAEGQLFEPEVLRHSPRPDNSMNRSRNSPHNLSTSPGRLNRSINQSALQFGDLEVPTFQYQRIFSQQFSHLVQQLVTQLQLAKGSLYTQTQATEESASFLS